MMERGIVRRSRFLVVLGVLAMALVGIGVGPSAAAGEPTEAIPPVRTCGDLVGDYQIPGAVTHVESATEVTDVDPEYCLVTGKVEPAVNFHLKLPLTTFSGRYLQFGCDGYCGFIKETTFPDCGGPHGGDFAVAATDDGHVSPPPFPFIEGKWAENNRVARNDFFYRAPHVVSQASKRIIAKYYGSPPTKSYFTGCSNGGREGMLLAQRYPHDFDGIIASAPAVFMQANWGESYTWMARSNTGPDGAPILTAPKIHVLHNAVVAACDGLDGLVDGQIDDPRACRFDPGTLRCPPGTDQPGCLNSAQVDTVRKLYAGPRDANGRLLHPGWQLPGTEPIWESFVLPLPGQQFGFAELGAESYLRHMGYPDGVPHSTVADFRFTATEFHRLTLEGFKGNALSLDLREFRRSGVKLIMWQGWNDMAVPAIGTLDYYQRLWQRNGGLRETQEWARLFLVPTFFHCFGGYRLDAFVDPVSELVAWAERGQAPDRLIATGTDPRGAARSRPVFPYPLTTRYDGSGSINDASNFVPAPPASPPRDVVDWVGSYLYSIPGPVAR